MSNPPAHRVPSLEQIESARLAKQDIGVFFSNLDVLLAAEQTILSCDQYFFCRPPFATYGIYGSKQITLGALLIGWRLGILRDFCCTKLGPRTDKYSIGGTSHVYHFGGLSSGPKSVGFCTTCKGYKRSYNKLIFERMTFVESIQEQCKDWVEGLEITHSPPTKYNFVVPAIVPSSAGRLRRTKLFLVEAVTVKQLVAELTTGNIRAPTSKDKTLLPKKVFVKCDGNSAVKAINLIE